MTRAGGLVSLVHMEKIPVGILGATGAVGQKFVKLLEGHPWFEIAELVASQRSSGKPYREAVQWKQATPIPYGVGDRVVKGLDDPLESLILFSGLDSSVAGDAETHYARKGHWVISNSKNHRMDPDVPLVIPEINPDHFELVRRQTTPGKIVTNSNCSTMFLAMALYPLHRRWGVRRVLVTTLQAISGAGYPGVPSWDILGNVVPFIADEEEKMQTEPQKILGTLDGGGVRHASIAISALCHRVPVLEGHTESVSVELDRKPGSLEEVVEELRSFRGLPQERGLPFAPKRPLVVLDEPDRPQPLRDVDTERGMATLVGRVRPCPVFDVKMTLLGHNTVRGAAGAAILNAEALIELGYLSR